MLDSQLPRSLWAEAINTANYPHARSPASANKGVTPYEKLNGSKPTISHLRRFGYKAYRMLPAAQRHGKFASRAETVYMLGYVHDSTSIWCLLNTERQRVIQASNVRFDELVTLGLYRNQSVERIKGNQATFNNSRRNNLRSCMWVSSVVFGLLSLSSGRERSTYIGSGWGEILCSGLTIPLRPTDPHLSVGPSDTPIGPGRYWR